MLEFIDFGSGGASLAADAMARVRSVMRARGVTLPRAAFQAAVKIAFFASAAVTYDQFNRNLQESLPEQFQVLAGDYLSQFPPPSPRMTALDVGCGTGMTAEIVLRTRLGAFIRHMDLLDPSREMLDICESRDGIRAIRHRPIAGCIHDLPERYHYDLILAGCVLQHIPDLPDFLRQVALRQPPGGLFLHVQDPNSDYLRDPERLERVARLARSRRVRASTLLKQLSAAGPWRRNQARASQFERVNRDLLESAIIATRMTDAEINLVVDLPAHDGRGVSIHEMRQMLPGYDLVSCRSYAFFGELMSDLPPAYRKQERALIAERAANGSQVAAVWMKRGVA